MTASWQEAGGDAAGMAGESPGDEFVVPVTQALRRWGKELTHDKRSRSEVRVPRVALDVRDSEFAGYSWERVFSSMLSQAGVEAVVVRTSPVRPRVAATPLTYPVRLLELNPRRGRRAVGPVVRMLRHVPGLPLWSAIDVASSRVRPLPELRERLGWPTADVLHFGRYPLEGDPAGLLRTGDPEHVGTLGWLGRLTETWQVRLLVVDCQGPQELTAVRRLAHHLAARGGPAVLAVSPSDTLALGSFYRAIARDAPLDAAVQQAGRSSIPDAGQALFVGSGREELLRVSSTAVALLKLERELARAVTQGVRSPDVEEVRELSSRRAVRGARAPDTREIHRVLSRRIARRRSLIGAGLGVGMAVSRVRRSLNAKAGPPPPRGKGTRFVNSRLGVLDERGALQPIEQKGASLQVGQTYQLSIQIGPQDTAVRVFGAAALLEEVFKWGPGVQGRWLEIGVTGIDFDILGDPVQELWMPREGASEEIAFAVSPRRPGAAVLRFCVYLDQNVVQSFRLAAMCRGEQTGPSADRVTDRPVVLAQALGLRPQDVNDAGYLTRLEYSVVSSAEAIGRQPPRTLSIVVNDLDGQSRITVKGVDHFKVKPETNLADVVREAREWLDRASVGACEDQDPATMPYLFGSDPNLNVGTPAQLEGALVELAASGWSLFNRVIGWEEHNGERLAEQLRGRRAMIHVAHILRPKVIPWACMYDRPYNRHRRTYKGRDAGHAACLAPLLPASQDPPSRCGTHPSCLLHDQGKEAWEAANGKVLCEETVACPLHFWGFRHIIEVPPMQVGAKEEGRDLLTCILSKPPPRIRAGLNTKLLRADSHVAEVDVTVGEACAGGTVDWARGRDDVLDGLDDALVDLIYLYCHAQGGEAGEREGIRKPVLLFAEADGTIGRIHAEQFAGNRPRWAHGPLVFLNGCKTVGFSPDGLSPFIETLVRDRNAAGIIGTEVSVWEQVATEMARRFFREFLRGKGAGEALLEARWGLLREKNNPLGLMYTLYASADLAIDVDGDGQCSPSGSAAPP